jgi:hypothetical protein
MKKPTPRVSRKPAASLPRTALAVISGGGDDPDTTDPIQSGDYLISIPRDSTVHIPAKR